LARTVVFSACIMALFTPHWAMAEVELKSNFVRLVFSDQDDIARLDKKIDFGDSGGWFAASTPAAAQERLLRKIDAIYTKVQRILDMRKPPMQPTVVLQVARDEDELAAISVKIFKRRASARAWYVYMHNTVYINVRDVHAGMIAHELAHAIIDHYFSAPPPRNTAEILATAVDRSLFDEVKTRNDFQ